MRFLKNNTMLLAFCFLASVTVFNSQKAVAGGDPSIKDKKVNTNNSNIKQHDHNKTYVKDQKRLTSSDKGTKKQNQVNSRTMLAKMGRLKQQALLQLKMFP